ncbi:MAG: helix-turn-helix transcriptional regulator [Bacillota bacterium]
MDGFPELLKMLRKEKGYSLRQVERLAGNLITHGYLHTLERGYDHHTGKPVMPSPTIIKVLAEVYSYPYKEMLRAAGYLPPCRPRTLYLEEVVKKNNIYFQGDLLDEKDKEDLLEILNVVWKALKKRVSDQ